MGQEEPTGKITQSVLQHTTHYVIDPRLVQYKNTLPSYFSDIGERVVQELTQMISRIPQHPLQQYLTHSIDSRFQRKKIGESDKLVNQEWFQLANQQRFLNLLNFFAKQYALEQLIHISYEELGSAESKAFQTLRNPFQLAAVPTLSEQLIIRMLLGYFLKLFKTYANSGEKHMMRFYDETGRQLALMMLKGHLSLGQLYSLFFQFVYMDKHSTETAKKLQLIKKIYHGRCLRTQYSINVEKRDLNRLQIAARLYLDQLYLNSLREAQDPEIRFQEDSLSPVRMFPISRVKDKPRS